MYVCVYTVTHMWRLKDNVWKEVLSTFHHVGLRDQIQVIRLGGKYLYPLSYLISPKWSNSYKMVIPEWVAVTGYQPAAVLSSFERKARWVGFPSGRMAPLVGPKMGVQGLPDLLCITSTYLVKALILSPL